MIRAKEYLQFLSNIYGGALINQILYVDVNTVKYRNLNKILDVFTPSLLETQKNKEKHTNHKDYLKNAECQICKELYENKIKWKKPPITRKFTERNMDIPAWYKELRFNNDKSSKSLMILGESVTPSFKNRGNNDVFLSENRQINLTFEFGVFFPQIQLNKKGVYSSNFWKKLGRLFNTSFKPIKGLDFDQKALKILENLYITDLGKCNCDGVKDLFTKCAQSHFLKEIELIKPKILIMQGEDALEGIKHLSEVSKNFSIKKNEKTINLVDFTSKHNKTERRKFYNKSGRFGCIRINDFKIKYITIPHTSSMKASYQSKTDVWDVLRDEIGLEIIESI